MYVWRTDRLKKVEEGYDYAQARYSSYLNPAICKCQGVTLNK
jgi:hypothetical protein